MHPFPRKWSRHQLLTPLTQNSGRNLPHLSSNKKIDISLVNAAAFLRACSLPGSQQFSLNLADIEVSGRSASTSKLPDPVDLFNVPEEYHEFVDVFDKAKAQTLAPHRPYDLKINLEEGYTPPLRQVYSLSQTELKALREFLDENLATGFISSTRSPHGAPILFVKRRMVAFGFALTSAD